MIIALFGMTIGISSITGIISVLIVVVRVGGAKARSTISFSWDEGA